MVGEQRQRERIPASRTVPIGYTPGWFVLGGLLIGALAGTLAEPLGAVPVGMAVGLAAGVGIDSLLNHRINGPFEDPVRSDRGPDRVA